MNITSVRHPGIPGPQQQERPAVQDGARRQADPTVAGTAAGTRTVNRSRADEGAALTEDEQRFFEDLYPGAVSELRASATYTRGGLQPGHGTGSHFDRRG